MAGGGRDSNGEAGPQQGGSAQRLKTGKGVHRGGVRRTGKAVHPKALRVLDAEKNGGGRGVHSETKGGLGGLGGLWR